MVVAKDTESARIDAYLSLLTTINKGMLDILGPASKGLIFNTGVEEGRSLGSTLPKTNTLTTAIDTINEAYDGVWSIELQTNKGESTYFFEDDLGLASFRILVRDCPIRAAVTDHNLEQAGPICYLTNGHLCGVFEEIMDESVGMEIEYAGPLACKKRIYFRK